MTSNQTILMCAPGYFSVDYVINDWMKDQTNKVSRALAASQWENLRNTLARFIKLAFVPAQPGVPDLVFTANAGLVVGEKVIVSRFSLSERQAEEPLVRQWFAAHGFKIADWPQHVAFEGAGDALLDRGKPVLWVGHGFRSDAAAPALVEKIVGCQTVALKLIDPRFYHLDTCFCPLERGWLLYYPAAFHRDSLEQICALVPEDKRIEVGRADAMQFACNAVSLDRHVVLNHASEKLQNELRRAGFVPILTPLTEFIKAGGSAKCLTLKLVEA